MKRKIFTLILFVLSLQVSQGQQQLQVQLSSEKGETYSQAIARSMQKLNTARIPYNTLYERVVGWANLTSWNNGNTTDFTHIKQAWWDLENSKTLPTNTFDDLREQVETSISQNKIPLLAIHFGFGYVDSLAFQDGRMRIENNQLVDEGRALPYFTKRVHIAALATEQVVENSSYQLITASSFLLNNLEDEGIIGYSVENLNTGYAVKIIPNATEKIVFSKSGNTRLKITVRTTKGSYVSYQNIEVLPQKKIVVSKSPTSKLPEHKVLTSSIPFQGYGESSPTISYADYHIYYHFINNDTLHSERILKKPIIILDGFDPLDQRNYHKIYREQLAYNNNNKRILLGHELRLKGYDVIILNFPITGTKKTEKNKTDIDIPLINGKKRDGGTDYIERNAFLLVKLIQELNAKLKSNGSNEELVIVGPSMGGQISRYALAYMEKHNMPHNTRLWVSFDSPHLGANIPLAIQKDLHFFGYQGEKQAAKDAYESQLYSPAARQMLIEQLDGLNGTSYFHTRYYNSLKNNGLPGSNGFPQNLHKVALINGSGQGKTTNSPAQMFLTLTGKKLGVTFVKIRNRFMPSTNESIEYFNGKVTTKGWIYISFLERRAKVYNANIHGSMDVVPGGLFNAQEAVKKEFDRAIDNEGLKTNWTIINNHCFIPTVSALAFKNTNFHWSKSVYNRDLVQTNEIPFDNYFIPQNNQQHVTVTKESAFWLFSQLSGNYYNHTNPPTLSGPSLVCSQATYNIENLPTGARVQWSTKHGKMQLISGQGTGIAKFNSIGNKSEVIKAKININGHTNTLEKTIYINDFDIILSGNHGSCDNPIYYYSAPKLDNVTYTWKKNGVDMGIDMNKILVFIDIPGGTTTSLNIELTISSADCSLYKSVEVNYYKPTIEECYGWDDGTGNIGFKPSFTVYPNPTTSEISIEIREAQVEKPHLKASQTASQTPYELQLWNATTMLKRQKTTDKTIQMQLGNFPKGTYFLHLIKDGETHKQMIKLE